MPTRRTELNSTGRLQTVSGQWSFQGLPASQLLKAFTPSVLLPLLKHFKKSLIIKTIVPVMRDAPSRPNHLPEALPPNVITSGVRISNVKFGGTQSITGLDKMHLCRWGPVCKPGTQNCLLHENMYSAHPCSPGQEQLAVVFSAAWPHSRCQAALSHCFLQSCIFPFSR